MWDTTLLEMDGQNTGWWIEGDTPAIKTEWHHHPATNAIGGVFVWSGRRVEHPKNEEIMNGYNAKDEDGGLVSRGVKSAPVSSFCSEARVVSHT